MADNKKEMERDELHRAIWAIADDLRGAVDGWDFKNYMLVKKYHDTHCEDKEVLVSIKKAIDSSPELRSKKALIENFIAGINEVDDIMIEWHDFVAENREKDLVAIIQEEKLKEEETRRYMDNCFRDGEIKTIGTDIEKIMPPSSRFGGGNKAEKKQGVIEKLKAFFEKYFGIGTVPTFSNIAEDKSVTYQFVPEEHLMMVAEEPAKYGSEQ